VRTVGHVAISCGTPDVETGTIASSWPDWQCTGFQNGLVACEQGKVLKITLWSASTVHVRAIPVGGAPKT
jgi:hypothetical protein